MQHGHQHVLGYAKTAGGGVLRGQSAKALFRATKPKPKVDLRQSVAFPNLPDQRKPEEGRDPLDYDPTPRDATAAFLSVEGDRMREIGGPIWEPAVGGGHMARELQHQGFDVIGSDIVDRGWPGTEIKSFYDYEDAPAEILFTNPPYCEITTRGHGRWLRHIFDLKIRYVALLLGWDWFAGRINGLDLLHNEFPMSRAYVCCWKIDFRGGGQAPQRNGFIVWDRDWHGETVLRRLFRDHNAGQGKLL